MLPGARPGGPIARGRPDRGVDLRLRARLSHAESRPGLYCATAFRHLYSQQEQYASQLPGGLATRLAFRAYCAGARVFDRIAAASIAQFVTQSPFTVELIRQTYGRTSQILAPPVDCDIPSVEPLAEGLLPLRGAARRGIQAPVDRDRRVRPHAREAPAGRRRRSGAAGAASARDRQRRIPRRASRRRADRGDAELPAAVFPSVDDFGLVPLEINACGRPVLAYQGGGALHGAAGRQRRLHRAADRRRGRGSGQGVQPELVRRARDREHALRWSASGFRHRLREAADEVVARDGSIPS